MDVLAGLAAIVGVFFVLALKESENKVLAAIGFGIIVLAKAVHSGLDISGPIVVLLLCVGGYYIIKVVKRNKESNEAVNRTFGILSKYTAEELTDRMKWEIFKDEKISELMALKRKQLITSEEYSLHLDALKVMDNDKRAKCDLSRGELEQFFKDIDKVKSD